MKPSRGSSRPLFQERPWGNSIELYDGKESEREREGGRERGAWFTGIQESDGEVDSGSARITDWFNSTIIASWLIVKARHKCIYTQY